MSVDYYLVVLVIVQSCGLPRHPERGQPLHLAGYHHHGSALLFFVHVFNNELQVPRCKLHFLRLEQACFLASHIYTLVWGFAIPEYIICMLYVDLLPRFHTMRLHSGAKILGKAKRKVTVLVPLCWLCTFFAEHPFTWPLLWL